MPLVRLGITAVILMAGGLLLLQCAALGDRGGKGGSFDPLAFPGDDTVLTANAKPLADPDNDEGPAIFLDSDSDTAGGAEQVLRVQFFATTSLSEAEDVMQRASRSLSYDVSVDYETPYYKLMIGPLRDEDAAERLVVKLRAMGYESAWIVRERSDK